MDHLVVGIEAIREAVEAAEEVDPNDEKTVSSAEGSSSHPTHAKQLIELAERENVQLFHDTQNEAWASIIVNGHVENFRVRSPEMHLFLRGCFYRATGEAVGGEALQNALGVLEARALFSGDERTVHIRVAERSGKYYLDLCDEQRRCVEIDDAGWRVIANPPVAFRRPRTARALPVPEPGMSATDLKRFLNVDRHGLTLVLAYMAAALRPCGPYPILVIKGEQGTAKSTACRIVGSLIDPRAAQTRGEPHNIRDLVAAAKNSHLVSFDNLSHLPDELADASCRLATGGGFGGRALFTDDEEAVFDAMRPLLFNAIPDLGATRGDFLERAIILELKPIDPKKRIAEQKLWADFDAAKPKLFGALLAAISQGLGRVDSIDLKESPRMADFARWAIACEPGLGLNSGEFMAAYTQSIAQGVSLALEGSPLYGPLQNMADRGFRGSATELLTELNMLAGDAVRVAGWPKAPNGLSNTLRRMSPNLRKVGIVVEIKHSGDRTIFVHRAANIDETSSTSSEPSDVETTDDMDASDDDSAASGGRSEAADVVI